MIIKYDFIFGIIAVGVKDDGTNIPARFSLQQEAVGKGEK